MSPNEIYQYSIVSALMDGVASKGLPISKLITHGDHGLGTFRNMVGEMIILDGSVYQMKSDGTITAISSSEKDAVAPFAMTTFFKPTVTVHAVLGDKADLDSLINALLPHAHNLYVAYKMQGKFRNLTVRTAGGQEKPREGLAEIGKRQTSHTFDDGTEGTVFGFRSPAYTQGISVAGDHLHFISKDRNRGGHILALASEGEIEVEVASISKFNLELPIDDEDFNEATLQGDSDGIKAVEG